MGSKLLSVVERCPLYGGAMFSYCFCGRNICLLLEGVCCVEVSIKGPCSV